MGLVAAVAGEALEPLEPRLQGAQLAQQRQVEAVLVVDGGVHVPAQQPAQRPLAEDHRGADHRAVRAQRAAALDDGEGLGGLDQKFVLGLDAPRLMSGMSLQKEEVNLIAFLDGILSVEEICSQIRGNDFLTCRALYGLWAAGVLDRVPEDRPAIATHAQEKTDPHAERLRGASVARELERFNELHRMLFELVTYELRERAGSFFERAFAEAIAEQGDLYEGVAVDTLGELDPFALRKNIATRDIASYARGLDRLLEIETELVRTWLGERKAAIIQDGLLALRQRQLEGASAPSRG